MNTRHITEESHLSREIKTVGSAILVQSVIRYTSYLAMAWLLLSFADKWVMAWIGAL